MIEINRKERNNWLAKIFYSEERLTSDVPFFIVIKIVFRDLL